MRSVSADLLAITFLKKVKTVACRTSIGLGDEEIAGSLRRATVHPLRRCFDTKGATFACERIARLSRLWAELSEEYRHFLEVIPSGESGGLAGQESGRRPLCDALRFILALTWELYTRFSKAGNFS